MELDATEKRKFSGNIKKETQEYYNYRTKEHLARNYRKLKTGSGPQKKKQVQKKPKK